MQKTTETQEIIWDLSDLCKSEFAFLLSFRTYLLLKRVTLTTFLPMQAGGIALEANGPPQAF